MRVEPGVGLGMEPRMRMRVEPKVGLRVGLGPVPG